MLTMPASLDVIIRLATDALAEAKWPAQHAVLAASGLAGSLLRCNRLTDRLFFAL
jgi:hypothetical protein